MDWLKKLNPLNINLAPFKYEKIISKGWPINNFEIVELKNLYSQPIYECYSNLSEKIRNVELQSKIYGNYDGSGTSQYKAEAVYKSFSESIERWACYEISKSKSKEIYGYDITPSSTGFAAFPSIGRELARKKAYFEAIERWSLTHWWEEGLQIQEISPRTIHPQLKIWEIQTPFDSTKTVLLQLLLINGNPQIAAYGFATADSIERAIDRAVIELDRNRRAILIKTRGAYYESVEISQLISIHDKRLIYFTYHAGINSFLDKIKITKKIKFTLSKPKLIIDKEVLGPWSRYAHVWRCLLEKNEPNNFDDKLFFF